MNAPDNGRLTQPERRIRSRNAILAAAARGIALHGYSALSLTRVAQEAGYTRGALYHQFASKEDLAIAVVAWIHQTWEAEVGIAFTSDGDPAETLLNLARRHAHYCRRDVAAVLMNLRVEFSHRDHPVGHAITDIVETLVDRCQSLIEAGLEAGTIPPGPPSREMALAMVGALEAVPIQLVGRPPHDMVLTERTVRGILALPPS
ncbi:TetR/AcrR family transcriptional regulator [Natronoglycomyces albus]|uniref:TetR/AcrR family transcriptional regulator n=1 Tax=Natronoglycomyces albus TaxID=2811108 RepID=A0A895XVD7_9ACTN|nr:TetR/AcrR family transcriptional regulator [Natronoglycomyces albus]QSB06486.1 TetR/AcrR family transcriptional regulator [Natronoglycomyces albus]